MLSLLLCVTLAADPEGDLAKRQAYLDELLRILPESKEWREWLDQTGELPPDFDAMPSQAELPDPLRRAPEAEPISDPEEWRDWRETLKARVQHWITGTIPPAPDNLEATVLSEREEVGARVREVELRFGPQHKARLGLELLIPEGEGPFPVFMTQHNHRGWALIALRRGYLACVYAGADSRDDTESFIDAYPGYDWSRLMRRGWAASRCIDYLESVPEARTDQVVLTGHSRNGKTSLMASAFDERIAAVISSSSGSGGSLTARYNGEHQFGEGVENITRAFPSWFHPRFRFFAGREHKLPVDLHTLVALSAPRPCLLSSAYHDGVESTWGIEETYLAVKPVYALSGAEDNLRILWRPGGHETAPDIIEQYLDWSDAHFGRGGRAVPERLIHPHAADVDSIQGGDAPNVESYSERPFGGDLLTGDALRERIPELLGEMPPRVLSPRDDYGREPTFIKDLLHRGSAGSGLERDNFVFGDYLNADVYMPEGTRDSGRKIPAILWLHPASYPKGYLASYRRGEQAVRTFAKGGFAVFAYDQIGFGRRIFDVEGFYDRYPRRSILGQMVRDAQAALDALMDLPYVDTQNIWVVSYALGTLPGLHLGALDDRPAGAVFIGAPPPFRLDTDRAETGGIRRWSHLYAVMPRLGAFEGHEARVPYDVDDLLAAWAPRPVVMVTPRLDREAPLAIVERGIESARRIHPDLEQITPDTYNHFDDTMQAVVVEALRKRALSEE